MSEKRFEIIGCTVWMVDEDGEEELWNPQIVKILNKQQATINELQGQINRLNYIIEELRKNNYNKFERINKMKKENERLQKKITPSIYNKKDGNWKWNVDNNTILNIKTGEIFYLRNSGAVENLVGSLNTLHQENQELKKKNNALKEDINQSEKRVKHWMMLYEDVYDKMQKRRVSG